MMLYKVVAVILICQLGAALERLFSIDYENKQFLLDGKPFFYTAGEMHYFRVESSQWEDRLQKMAAAGLDAVTTYVAWNAHEPQPGEFKFSGPLDLVRFVQLAQKSGLLVILRPGPYICAEWDYGGFPAWLLADNITFQTRRSDPKYLTAVDRYLGALLPLMKPLLYHNGGPIIMVQVENEYGSTGVCDHAYMDHLVVLNKKFLDDTVVLFTCDGPNKASIQCGQANNTLATINFGPTADVASQFNDLRSLHPNNPLVVTELYTGWFDAWGKPHQTNPNAILINTLTQLRNLNASSSMYMFEGGTNFGYMNGLTIPSQKITTSYDYDAPLDETGDMTDKFEDIKQFMNKPPTAFNVSNSEKHAYGRVELVSLGNILDLLPSISESPMATHLPQNMEQSKHYFGFALYRHIFEANHPLSTLHFSDVRDRAYIMIDGFPVGVVENGASTSIMASAMRGQTLDILVENWGRFNFGPEIDNTKKGIFNNVSFGPTLLTSWTLYPIDINKIFDLISNNSSFTKNKMTTSNQYPNLPTLYYGQFDVAEGVGSKDTFLNTCGWHRGQAFINKVNLGRYRPTQGPQITLYVPGAFIAQRNQILMFELEQVVPGENMEPNVVFVDRPLLNGRCFTQLDTK